MPGVTIALFGLGLVAGSLGFGVPGASARVARIVSFLFLASALIVSLL